MKRKIKIYLFFILFTLAVGGLSAILTKDNMNIFDTVEKPVFAPPEILFPIVWSILYTVMGIGMGGVFISASEKDESVLPSLTFYLLQLFVNFFWSVIFFNLQNFLLSFIWLLLLLVLAAAMTFKFFRINKIASLIQIPYLLWLIFAAVLNYAVFYLNSL